MELDLVGHLVDIDWQGDAVCRGPFRLVEVKEAPERDGGHHLRLEPLGGGMAFTVSTSHVRAVRPTRLPQGK